MKLVVQAAVLDSSGAHNMSIMAQNHMIGSAMRPLKPASMAFVAAVVSIAAAADGGESILIK